CPAASTEKAGWTLQPAGWTPRATRWNPPCDIQDWRPVKGTAEFFAAASRRSQASLAKNSTVPGGGPSRQAPVRLWGTAVPNIRYSSFRDGLGSPSYGVGRFYREVKCPFDCCA